MKSILLATLAATAFLIPTVSYAADQYPGRGDERVSSSTNDDDGAEYPRDSHDRDDRRRESRIEGRIDNEPRADRSGNGGNRGRNRTQSSNVYVPAAQPDGRYYDRNRDGDLDRRWDRNRDDHIDRNWDRNRDGRLDHRYDHDNDDRLDRRYDRDRNGDLDNRWDRNNDNRQDRWNTGWRNDRRYDWRGHRNAYGNTYRQGRYYGPQYGRSYNRISIGFTIGSPYYGSRYWVNNPGYYHLPAAYGAYRWVRYYDDVLMVDIRNGYVVDKIDNFFW